MSVSMCSGVRDPSPSSWLAGGDTGDCLQDDLCWCGIKPQAAQPGCPGDPSLPHTLLQHRPVDSSLEFALSLASSPWMWLSVLSYIKYINPIAVSTYLLCVLLLVQTFRLFGLIQIEFAWSGTSLPQYPDKKAGPCLVWQFYSFTFGLNTQSWRQLVSWL